MEDNHFKNFSFLVKCVLLIQLVHCINNHKCEAKAKESDLYNRMSNLEVQNRNQEKEISLLKMEKVEDRMEIRQLIERVNLLEASNFSNSSYSSEKLQRRLKRPARLLPPNILRPKKHNETEEETSKKFYGPPTNCDDLKRLGYTLNGYYLIKGESKLNAYRIQVKYCSFYQPTSVKPVSGDFIGNLDVRTKSVHFYVQRNSTLGGRLVISFDLARLNEGNAFNLSSGIFTAPVKGIYHFQLSAVKATAKPVLSIALQVNGVAVGVAFTQQPDKDYNNAVSLSASLRLNASDKVNLYTQNGQITDVVNPLIGDHKTHFTGWLVEEDLM